jgi:succinylglutamate desuccinylase
MTNPRVSPPRERLIGRYDWTDAGPTLLVIAGIHGNEPAGVEAVRRVLATLERVRPRGRGRFVALAGNLQALERGVRFLASDLNRIWRADRLERVRSDGHADALDPEERELRELDALIRRTLEDAGEVCFLDLHTTSSRSAPFAIINDTLAARAHARHLGVPIVLGLEEQLAGTVADFAHKLGCVTVGFEAGRHNDPASVDVHEAAVWVTLKSAGLLLGGKDVPVRRSEQTLAGAARGLPRYIEIIDHHPVREAASFRMMPGYRNLQRIPRGALLAYEKGKPVRARRSGRLLMPLYQGLGDSGFFLVNRVRPVWLALSGLLRRLGIPALAHWLPGVKRHPRVPGAVLVQTRVARWGVREVFHLLGYRQLGRDAGLPMFVSRERECAARQKS